MGYRGKLDAQIQARELRAQAWTLPEIAEHLGVAKSSVSRWTRDVAFDPSQRRSVRTDRRPRGSDHPLRRRKEAEIAAMAARGRERVGEVAPRDVLVAGAALYAGDGAKRDGEVKFANSDPRLVAFFCRWLRACFDIDESRLRVRLYLHQGLELAAAQRFWSEVTAIPTSQFTKPYRAVPDGTIRHSKHVHGCAHVVYASATVHREVLGLIRALFPPA